MLWVAASAPLQFYVWNVCWNVNSVKTFCPVSCAWYVCGVLKRCFSWRCAVLPWFALAWGWWVSPAQGAGPCGTQRGHASWCSSRLINKPSCGCTVQPSPAEQRAGRDGQQEHYPYWIAPPSWSRFECFGIGGEWNNTKHFSSSFSFVFFFFSAVGFRMHKESLDL